MSQWIRHFALRLALAGLGLVALNAYAGEIQGVSVDNGATGTRAEIHLSGAGQFKTMSLSNPARLVVDFPDSNAVKGLKLPAGSGVVAEVRSGQPTPGTFRVVFDLKASVVAFKPQMDTIGGNSTLVIQWPGEGPAAAPTPAAASSATPPVAAVDPRAEAARATAALTASVVAQAGAKPIAATTPSATAAAPGLSPAQILAGAKTDESAPVAATDNSTVLARPSLPRPAMPSDVSRIRMTSTMRPLVVAIDPGHGGQDPGATGPTGKHEKDVTLAIGRELARLVNATPGLKAYMTRDTDVFIPLNLRAKKARAAGADIFISIHADAAENRSATGSSVFVLSTKGASSQRARWLADKENAADLVGGVRLQQTDSTLASVLIDLAQSGHMKASEDVARNVLGQLGEIGNNHKSHIERANFAVLRTSDMPAMLVETAFISNPTEEKQLISPGYQHKIAKAVLTGVEEFFTRQPPPGTLFAARAQAEADAAATVAGGSR